MAQTNAVETKTLTKEEMENFKNSMSAAEEYPDAKSWVNGLKRDLREMKPEWSRKDVNTFLEAHVSNHPVVKEILAHSAKKDRGFSL